MNIIAIALISTAVIFCGCSASEQDRGRENFKEVENGTGKVLENAGEIVGAGADAVDQSWETPAEQRRNAAKQQEDGLQDDGKVVAPASE